jgi:hypothetical protein
MPATDSRLDDPQPGASGAATYKVGYCRPPVHSRFKPGQSGNPSGRAKGSKNLKSLFDKILNEQITLQDGAQSRKVSKGEAIIRRLIIGALKGDARSLSTLFRLVAQTGELDHERYDPLVIQPVIFQTGSPAGTLSSPISANSQVNRD